MNVIRKLSLKWPQNGSLSCYVYGKFKDGRKAKKLKASERISFNYFMRCHWVKLINQFNFTEEQLKSTV